MHQMGVYIFFCSMVFPYVYFAYLAAHFTPDMKGLDDIDRHLLDILQDNSQITIRELSGKLKLSSTPIHERIKKLERNGYIKGRITLLDYKKLGYGLHAYVMVTLQIRTQEALNNFVTQINEIPEVLESYYVSGQWDFLCKVCCIDMDAYHSMLVGRFSHIPNVGALHSLFVLNEIKVTHKVPLV